MKLDSKNYYGSKGRIYIFNSTRVEMRTRQRLILENFCRHSGMKRNTVSSCPICEVRAFATPEAGTIWSLR